MIKYFLCGRHSHRTPLSYPLLTGNFLNLFSRVEDYKKANIIVLGFVIDIKENMSLIEDFMGSVPNGRVAVISEEPLWDTIWGGDYKEVVQKRFFEGHSLDFLYFNHENSNFFNFSKIPYFIRTSSIYINRYAHLFSRNSKLSELDFKDKFSSQLPSFVAYAEKRSESKFNYHDPINDVHGLSKYRTDLSIAINLHMPAEHVGAGWQNNIKRQSLPDWHLDKLVGISSRYFFSSALENTHQINYVTEKFFDSMGSITVPIYYASPSHYLNRICNPTSYINVYGLTVEQAVSKIISFQLDGDFLSAYRSAQCDLFKVFSDFNSIAYENKLFFKRMHDEISDYF